VPLDSDLELLTMFASSTEILLTDLDLANRLFLELDSCSEVLLTDWPRRLFAAPELSTDDLLMDSAKRLFFLEPEDAYAIFFLLSKPNGNSLV
jgi:hypothetical protein